MDKNVGLCLYMWILIFPLIPFPSYLLAPPPPPPLQWSKIQNFLQFRKKEKTIKQMQICFLTKIKIENW